MIISYYGKQFFKIQQGDKTIALNPLSKENSLKKKPSRFGSDLALISTHHKDFNGIDTVSYNNKEPFVISGPGIYEVDGITIYGYGQPTHIDGEPYLNTVYFFEFEGIRFLFAGALENEEISQEAREHTESVHIMFVPVGGEEVLTPVQAAKFVKDFTPNVVIPMDYGKDRDPASLDAFLKELGGEREKNFLDKFVFKKSEIEAKTDTLILLSEN